MTSDTGRFYPELVFEKAPGRKVPPTQSDKASRQRRYQKVVEECKANPGEPYVIRGYASPATATQMRKGQYPAIDPAAFMIETRRNKDQVRYDVYLTYIGEPDDDSE